MIGAKFQGRRLIMMCACLKLLESKDLAQVIIYRSHDLYNSRNADQQGGNGSAVAQRWRLARALDEAAAHAVPSVIAACRAAVFADACREEEALLRQPSKRSVSTPVRAPAPALTRSSCRGQVTATPSQLRTQQVNPA
eukprot:2593502-Pleurochrysis_carterae.AAC.6